MPTPVSALIHAASLRTTGLIYYFDIHLYLILVKQL